MEPRRDLRRVETRSKVIRATRCNISRIVFHGVHAIREIFTSHRTGKASKVSLKRIRQEREVRCVAYRQFSGRTFTCCPYHFLWPAGGHRVLVTVVHAAIPFRYLLIHLAIRQDRRTRARIFPTFVFELSNFRKPTILCSILYLFTFVRRIFVEEEVEPFSEFFKFCPVKVMDSAKVCLFEVATHRKIGFWYFYSGLARASVESKISNFEQ